MGQALHQGHLLALQMHNRKETTAMEKGNENGVLEGNNVAETYIRVRLTRLVIMRRGFVLPHWTLTTFTLSRGNTEYGQTTIVGFMLIP
jgi:hypothetical protein